MSLSPAPAVDEIPVSDLSQRLQPPWNEAERLAALHRYGVLDSPREAQFEDIVRLAAEACDAPMAAVSLVDASRQWFKAEIGLDAREAPLTVSICAWTIRQPGLFVVTDLTRDPRFATNPKVAGEPGLRSYAGALLETPDGLPLGTLFVTDTRVRDFSERQGRTLQALARQVMTQLELRRALAERDAEIAQRIEAERTLRERERELARVQQIGGIGGLEVHLREGFRNRRSPEYLRVHGLPPEAVHESHEAWVSRVHPEDRARIEQAFRAAVAGTARDYAAEYRIVRPSDGETRWIAAKAEIERDPAGRPVRLVGAHIDVTERRQTEAALRESESRFRHMADSAPALIWMTDDEGRVVFANMHYDFMFGIPAAQMLGEGWRRIVVEEDLPAFEASFFEAFQARRPFRGELRVRDRDGAVRWLRCEGVPRLDDTGAFLGYTGCNVDITDAKVAQEHQELLINELNHRVKNTLATVQSITSQSLRGAASPEEARASIETRLLALSRAHDVLTRQNWEGAGVREIVAQAFEPYLSHGAERFEVEGPEVRLTPRVALAIAMALQELATNAVKYGALSNAEGRVSLRWSVDRTGTEPRLTLAWRESGGPPVTPPERRGFGSRLIERSLAQDLDGEAQIAFEPAGVVCTLQAALR